ncbi:MAG: hypothetical protein WCK05_00875 [Planctomycetota bacterium]|jgi:hypothetical protein
MADEQTPIAQNWRLLIVAFALGLVVMVVYNLHIKQVRNAGKGDLVQLMKSSQDIEPGKPLPRGAVVSVGVPKDIFPVLGDVILYKDRDAYVDAQKVQVKIREGTLVRLTNIKGFDTEASPIGHGLVSCTLPVDTNRTPGGVLSGRAGIWVNVVANMISVRAGEQVPVRLLRSARIIGIGEKLVEEPGGVDTTSGRPSLSGYRKVTIELDEKMADMMYELMGKAVGPVWLEMIAFGEAGESASFTDAAKKLLKR